VNGTCVCAACACALFAHAGERGAGEGGGKHGDTAGRTTTQRLESIFGINQSKLIFESPRLFFSFILPSSSL
jgi:hypothetical protein